MLCILTGDQAKTIVRSVESQCGLTAWNLLHSTYARQTLARTIRIDRTAINPDQALTTEEIIAAISQWETCVKDAEDEDDGNPIAELVRIAALTQT